MIRLNLPEYNLKIKEGPKGTLILDEIRNSFVRLTPEEWVRQNFLKYLVRHTGYPAGRIAVEMFLTVNGMKRRADIVVFDAAGDSWMIVECKSPDVKINSEVLKQIGLYNYKLHAKYLTITNGMNHFCISLAGESPELLREMPRYPVLSGNGG